jgi:hypothetical protein
MWIVPKFVIDWFVIMVLLVLKLFVSSHPLKLESVICIYVLVLHEGQAGYHFAMFSYMLETNKWLSMHFYSWSFVCVTFHIITRLLSSIVKIISFKPIFRALWSRLCWCMSPQKLLFCYHISIIFDAPCLFIHHFLCVLFTLRGVFMNFPKLTY